MLQSQPGITEDSYIHQDPVTRAPINSRESAISSFHAMKSLQGAYFRFDAAGKLSPIREHGCGMGSLGLAPHVQVLECAGCRAGVRADSGRAG